MGLDSNITETSKKRRLFSDSEVKPVKLPNIDHEHRESGNGNITDETENFDCHILVSNLPDDWNYNKLHTFFIKLFPFKKLEFEDEDNFDGTVKLTFDNKEQYGIAYQKLENVYADDRKVNFKPKIKEENNGFSTDPLINKETSEPQTSPSISSETNNELDSSGVQALESFEIDPSGLYGLKPSFLASLRIKPPIDSWVHVTNFRCDDTQLRNVMELAGHIVIFSSYFAPKYAKIMYSHPLEAVQAVSMLNGREFYGNKLKIIMIANPGDMITLPKGLAGIGPGLGTQGKPLRDIEKHFHRFLAKKPTALNISIFRTFCDNQRFTPIDSEEGNMAYVSTSTEKSDKTSNVTDSTQKSHVQKPQESKLSKGNDKKKVLETASSYKYSSDSDRSHSSPEPDNSISKCSDDKTSARSRSGSSNSSTISKNLLNSPKNIETIGIRLNLRASKAGPTWTPNVPLSNAAKPSFASGQIPRFPNNPVGIGSQRPMQSHIINQTGPIGPQFGQVGQSKPPGPMGQFGPMGPSGSMGPFGPMGPPGPMMPPGNMGQSGHMGPSGAMIPSRPMGSSGPIGPQPQMGNPGPMRPTGPIGGQNVEPVMLEFKNLPLSTTMSILCQKLSDIGQVVSLQFTTPGCALVRFANMAQAQMCFQRYNRTYAEGCLLEVRFV